jgi:hypothetical protein
VRVTCRPVLARTTREAASTALLPLHRSSARPLRPRPLVPPSQAAATQHTLDRALRPAPRLGATARARPLLLPSQADATQRTLVAALLLRSARAARSPAMFLATALLAMSMVLLQAVASLLSSQVPPVRTLSQLRLLCLVLSLRMLGRYRYGRVGMKERSWLGWCI